MEIDKFLRRFVSESDFCESCQALLDGFSIKYTTIAPSLLPVDYFVSTDFIEKHQELVGKIKNIGVVGVATDDTFNASSEGTKSIDQIVEASEDDRYQDMAFFSIDTTDAMTKAEIALLTRAFNRRMLSRPVVLFVKNGDFLSLSTCERSAYIRSGSKGEKVGRVNLLQNINCSNPSRAHQDILKELDATGCTSFDQLYNLWMSQFDITALNKQFYAELQRWFYWAVSEIELPDYSNTTLEEEVVNKNFVVRMLSRLMFCWFLKEKTDKNGYAAIDNRLLELIDYRTGQKYPIVSDVSDENFLNTSSYYRGVLQNVFFCGLNSNTKKSKKDFKCCRFLPDYFDYSILTRIPFLNGSTFRPLDEDFFKDSIDDSAISIPNYLFYGDENHRGINEIFHDYKFTVEENTPNDVDIALDPEMLGMVFENLLAEIDPQNDAGTARSIRNATGSFYTPRPVIQEMTNESISHYLYSKIKEDNANEDEIKTFISDLVYNDTKATDLYDKKVVQALNDIRILDPACGSGAFPMGMLQRIVDILRIVDPKNETWLQLMLEPINDSVVREQFRKQLSGSRSDYQRKLGIIRNCIYAIDIQPIAVQITKLRFFISLLADQEIDTTLPNSGILPFPNMETKIVCADSLKNLQTDFFVDQTKKELILARQKYYQPNIPPIEREKIADEIADIMDATFPTFALQIGLKQVSNKAALKHWFIDANINAPFFDMGTFFPEIMDGFDIVIGNPPYGGFKISQDVREALSLGSNDPYGAFIARFLGNGFRFTPLKYGGMLAFIVSDTFMTIGTHLELRKQMMHSRIHKMIRMSPKTFSATVNTVTIFCEKRKDIKLVESDSVNRYQKDIEGNICTMADMTNIDIHENYRHFVEVLCQSMELESDECIANEEYAIYRYPQTLIENCSNQPFFVASPKLFGLMQDENLSSSQKKYSLINGNRVGCRKVIMNGKEVSLYKLGDISDVKVGLQTGDNPAYLYQNPEARGTYRDINPYRKYILTDNDLDRIHSNEHLRLEIVEKGISKDDSTSERYFGGRYIARYDKGGESNADGGWMPNYLIPSDYYIDWSEESVKRMQTLTITDRIKINRENKRITDKTNRTKAAVIRNSYTYFKQGIAFSNVGVYSPTFRKNEGGPYDHDACSIYIETLSYEAVLAILASKLLRLISRTYVNHTVYLGVDDLKTMPILTNQLSELQNQVESIISNQKKDRYYDYASHEQIEIDRLVYEAYGLNDEDVKEVETWYTRRYPRLAAAQRNNLEKVRQQEA